MAGSLNKWMGIGRLGKEVDLRYSQGGKPIANFSIATEESWVDQTTNERKSMTEWVKCVAFGTLATNCSKLLSKGKLCYVEGRLQTRSWDDKDGVKRYTTEVVLNTMKVLSPKDSAESSAKEEGPAADDVSGGGGDSFDDIPFIQSGLIVTAGLLGKLLFLTTGLI